MGTARGEVDGGLNGVDKLPEFLNGEGYAGLGRLLTITTPSRAAQHVPLFCPQQKLPSLHVVISISPVAPVAI